MPLLCSATVVDARNNADDTFHLLLRIVKFVIPQNDGERGRGAGFEDAHDNDGNAFKATDHQNRIGTGKFIGK